jgi:hypothetical protein
MPDGLAHRANSDEVVVQLISSADRGLQPHLAGFHFSLTPSLQKSNSPLISLAREARIARRSRSMWAGVSPLAPSIRSAKASRICFFWLADGIGSKSSGMSEELECVAHVRTVVAGVDHHLLQLPRI